MATKPTKQQLAQSKTRAGGNNPIKVTSSGLKKLGTAAAIAASLTPVGRGIKAVGIAGKMAKTVDARRKFNAATEKRILDNQVKKSVKVLPRNTAPKTDLSNRGMKSTAEQRANRASDLQLNKAEKDYDSGVEMRSTGLRSYPKGYENSRLQSPKGKNLRKREILKVEANKKPLIRINSQRNLKAK